MNPFEIPTITQAKKVMFIQPHPDDNEVGAGATIAKLAANGTEVHYLTVTDGQSGSDDPNKQAEEIIETRQKEQKAAGHILGVKDYHWLGFTDGHLQDCESLRAGMVRAIRTVQPDMVFTVDPWLPYEAHLDHVVTGKVASFAALTSGNPRFYPEQFKDGLAPHRVNALGYYTTNQPNTYVNVDNYWENKIAAIRAHESQFSGEYLQFVEGYFTQKAMQLAGQSSKPCQFAEAFKILTPLMLHTNVDATNT